MRPSWRRTGRNRENTELNAVIRGVVEKYHLFFDMKVLRKGRRSYNIKVSADGMTEFGERKAGKGMKNVFDAAGPFFMEKIFKICFTFKLKTGKIT